MEGVRADPKPTEIRGFAMKRRSGWPVVVAMLVPWYAPGVAIAAEATSVDEEIVVTGSRRAGRSVGESPVPIDVLAGEDFVNSGTSDMNSLLSTLVPSYNVNPQPISDAATIMRPANLRGLPPDNTLVLVNGKRRHRGAVVAFLGGGIADGSQGADLASIPSIAIKQVEVLRDGASAQYGSDAIAGVINFILRDEPSGGSLEARYGEYYEGDGTGTTYAGNVGFALTDAGYANFSLEFNDQDATDRSVQRDDAAALIAAGNTAVLDPAQVWGSPEIRDDFKFFGNVGLDLGGGTQAYAFGNWSERTVEGGFFFRNPTNRGGVNDGPVVPDPLNPGATVDTILVADFTPGVSPCPVVPIRNLIPDPAALAAVDADPGCFAFNLLLPGGFTPSFGGDVSDSSFTAGVEGELSNGVTWDLSGSVGQSAVDYFISNTINPNLAELEGNMPRSFEPGSYIETDRVFNLDVSYPWDVGLFASPLNVAGGLEYREETFEIENGDANSFAIDPDLAAQGFGIGSNGFPGFKPADAGEFSSDTLAAYVDLEADVTDSIIVGIAGRYEDFEDFDSTADGKVSARWQIIDTLAIRGAVSTGFRVPTAGQANVRNVTTAFTNGALQDEATLPPTNPISVQKGGQALEPEESVSFTGGVVFSTGDFDLTVDFYNVEVTDRIALTTTIPLTAQDIADLVALGILDASSFTGVRFFVNGFDTTTQGIDIVATYAFEPFGGNTELSAALNWTQTEVDDFIQVAGADIIGETRIKQLEENLPEYRATLSATHIQGPIRGLLRVNYYDEYYEAHLDDGTLPINAGEEVTVDAELGYTFTENLSLVVGAQNVFDEEPDENPWGRAVAGSQFPATSPMGFNGGFWYARGIFQF